MKKNKEPILNTMMDIKVFLLFLLDNIAHPIDHTTLMTIIMKNVDVLSFDYDECLRELVDSEHLYYDEVDGERYYMISDMGRFVASELYDKCLPHAEKYKAKIAMETFGAARVQGARISDFFASPNEFLHQYNRLDTEYKTICVDTGHTHEAESFWVPPPEEMIKIHGKDISILHLHDNTGHWDDHLLPGLGNINWPAVLDSLDEVGYSGVYNFELRLPFFGSMLEDFIRYSGKYLREFVDRRGNLK